MGVNPPKTILICCFRLIGDVLVTTQLALSLKTAYPEAAIDYIVFEGTQKVLAKNHLVRNVITVPRSKKNLRQLWSLFRKYDLAIAANPSDRTVVAAAIAGKFSIGLCYDLKKSWWKKIILNAQCVCDDRFHIVSQMKSIAAQLGIAPIPAAVMGFDKDDTAYAQSRIAGRYILMHPYSMNRYKYWPAEKWGELAALIHRHTDCTAVFTATPSSEDNTFLEQILVCSPAEVATFPCTLNQFAAALKGCVAFVGVDTAATHIAAAVDAPTIALYGPSLTRYWGPWPNHCLDESPFAKNRGIQHNGNVTIVQKDWECVPCNQQSCAISKRNRIECLEEISPEEVLDQIMVIMNSPK